MAKPEFHLKLTEADMEKCVLDRLEKGKRPSYYHFKTPSEEFNRATLITYTGKDGVPVILKDLYGRTEKRRGC